MFLEGKEIWETDDGSRITARGFFLHSCDKDIEKRKKTMMCVGGLNRWKGKWKREEETEIEAK